MEAKGIMRLQETQSGVQGPGPKLFSRAARDGLGVSLSSSYVGGNKESLATTVPIREWKIGERRSCRPVPRLPAFEAYVHDDHATKFPRRFDDVRRVPHCKPKEMACERAVASLLADVLADASFPAASGPEASLHQLRQRAHVGATCNLRLHQRDDLAHVLCPRRA